MPRLTALLLITGLSWSIAGCGSGCPTALLSGVLIANGSELAIREEVGGVVREIAWPSGLRVRPADGVLEVADLFGGAKAREGDRVSLQGGESSPNGPWEVCGEIEVVDGRADGDQQGIGQ